MSAQINPILKLKVQQLSDYSAEPLATEELTELDTIIKDEEAPIEERILAARVMVNVSENRKLRAERSVKYWSNIHSALVHNNEKDRAVKSLTREGVEKLANVEGIEELLQAMVDRLKK